MVLLYKKLDDFDENLRMAIMVIDKISLSE